MTLLQQRTELGRNPFLRWAGSKKQMLPILAPLWNHGFLRYVEPFAGSACLFFRIAPADAVLSDTNERLIDTLLAVQSKPDLVATYLQGLPQDEETYYRVRSKQRESTDEFEAAAKFIFLNRLCFNGIYRTNASGFFNVPFGGAKAGALPSRLDLRSASGILQPAKVTCCDFEETLLAARHGDFVYIDPPYSVRSRRVFKEYDRSLFGTKSLIRLRFCLEILRRRGVSFVLSYADSREGLYLCRGLHTTSVSVRRTVAGFSEFRRMENELLAVSSDLEGIVCTSR